MQDIELAIKTVSTTGLSMEQRYRLIEAILTIPQMDELRHRESIVQELSTEIRSAVDSEPSAKAHVAKIVRTCLNYSEGLAELYSALKFFHGGTVALARLTELLKGYAALTSTDKSGPVGSGEPEPRSGMERLFKSDESLANGVISESVALSRSDPRSGVVRGMDIAARAVRAMLGPRGRKAILQRQGGLPLVTTHGYMVLREIELEDVRENAGVRVIADVAAKVCDAAGDGMTTAALLTYALSKGALDAVAAGNNPIRVGKGIEIAVARALDELALQSVAVAGDRFKIERVAAAAGRDEQVGSLAVEAVMKIGPAGAVIVEESQEVKDSLTFPAGLRIPHGWIAADFVADSAHGETTLDKPYILALNRRVAASTDIVSVLELIVKERRPLALFAEDVEGDALATLIVNKQRGILLTVAVKMPVSVEIRTALLEGIAAFTNGHVVGGAGGVELEHVTLADLGRADKIVVDKQQTILLAGTGREAVQGLRDKVAGAMERARNEGQRAALQKVLAGISGEIAVIKVGGASQQKISTKITGLRNAMTAARAAADEGVLPGGGIALLKAQKALRDLGRSSDERSGVAVVRMALEAPLETIARNAGFDGAEVVARVKSSPAGDGFNALSGAYENMADAGIFDSFRGVRLALQLAASAAAYMLTTEIVTTVGIERQDR